MFGSTSTFGTRAAMADQTFEDIKEQYFIVAEKTNSGSASNYNGAKRPETGVDMVEWRGTASGW